MSKAFVIKVKENCYWLGGFYGKNNYDDIAHAKVYVNKTQAEKQCKLVNESYGHSAEVVEITVVEGNLEQQLAIIKKALLKASKEAFGKVCERIRKELKQLELNIDNNPTLISNDYKLELKQKSIYKNIYEILDKIEKGECL